MSESKVEFKIGQITFVGQGEQEWVAKQLDKILSRAETLIRLAPETEGEATEGGKGGHRAMGSDTSIANKTLPAFLSEKNATRNQIRKFLATAIWLEAKGQRRLTTADVTKALKGANQTRLGNPADCLNKNVTKGHCEKDGRQFFVTDDGKGSL